MNIIGRKQQRKREQRTGEVSQDDVPTGYSIGKGYWGATNYNGQSYYKPTPSHTHTKGKFIKHPESQFTQGTSPKPSLQFADAGRQRTAVKAQWPNDLADMVLRCSGTLLPDLFSILIAGL